MERTKGLSNYSLTLSRRCSAPKKNGADQRFHELGLRPVKKSTKGNGKKSKKKK